MTACRLCRASLRPLLSLGRMPLADRFPTRAEFGREHFYNLEVGGCPNCGLVQLLHTVDPELLFRADYPYLSSSSTGMRRHFEAEARRLAEEMPPGGFLVELGCNDGAVCAGLARDGVRHLGVEPAAEVAAVAAARGVGVLVDFFTSETARRIRAREGPADVIYAANVITHIVDINDVLGGIDELLSDDGLLVIEEPYLGDIVAQTAFDQFYDEHAFYFSVTSVQRMLASHGLELVDVERAPVHGGSIRYTGARRGHRRVTDAVWSHLADESAAGLAGADCFDAFRGRVEKTRDRLIQLLADLDAQGQRVVGYGATAKSCTAINYCGITPELLACIIDSTPDKQGRFSPGAHIPILPPEAFSNPYPDYALLFAWNHAQEIIGREREFARSGGRWIVYVPEVSIIGM